MKKVVYILILLPFLISAEVQAQSTKQYLKAGEDFAKANNYADAIVQYTKAIELDPDNEKAYIQRAIANSRLGEHEKAAMDYDRALVFEVKDAELYYFSGNEWHLHGDHAAALIKLTTAINLKKNFLEAYQARMDVHMVLGQYEKALEDGLICLDLEEDENAYYNLAQVYEKLEMYSEADEAYRSSLRKNVYNTLYPAFSRESMSARRRSSSSCWLSNTY